MKPFLTKGSVAERVLLFEKRPTFKPADSDAQTAAAVAAASAAAAGPTGVPAARTKPSPEPKSPVLYGTWKNLNQVSSLGPRTGCCYLLWSID